MKNNVALVLAIFFFSGLLVNAQDKGFGLGIMLGEPTGVSAKYWLDNDKALDFGLAYSFFHSVSSLSLHCDYVFHNYNLIKSNLTIPVYYGFGARLHANSKDTFWGARGVIGLLYIDKENPIDAFIELAPVFNLFPETSLHFDLAIGARYYFR